MKCANCGTKAIGSIQGLGHCAEVECIEIVAVKALTPVKKFTEMIKDA